VLLNLAVNARDAMPEGGTIRLRGRRRFGQPARVGSATVRTDAPADWVTLEVTDSGPGIPPEIRERIFEPFFTTKEVGKGTGLGLATAYGIMAGLGGAIDVDAGEFGGTTFTLWLPPTEQPAADQRLPVAPTVLDLEGRILIVEDQHEVRRLTARILQRAGFTVEEVSNGREALELLARAPGMYDLVVSDVVMPDVGGRALAERLRQLGTPLPMIFISGYTPDLEPLVDPFGRTCEVLLKPFRAEDLVERVRNELARARSAAAND
jgi:two-component system cell cycle sensor histidine kinase/response regulator CckA